MKNMTAKMNPKLVFSGGAAIARKLNTRLGTGDIAGDRRIPRRRGARSRRASAQIERSFAENHPEADTTRHLQKSGAETSGLADVETPKTEKRAVQPERLAAGAPYNEALDAS
jgi:hypothetical protein